MDWNQVKVFAAVASAGTLSGAARDLGMSQPTVGRYIEALEQSLNVRLFDREPRGYAITAAGKQLLPQVAAMERAAYSIKDTSNQNQDQMTGTVRITAAEMSSRFIGRRLSEVRERLPGINLEVLTTNRTVNMSRREADIAIRAAMPKTGDLRVKQVYTGHMAIYAGHDYAAAHPVAYSNKRYDSCDWVTMMGRFSADIQYKKFLESKNVNRFPIKCASAHTVVEAVIGGAGLALMYTEYASDIPGLVQVSPVIEELNLTFWMVAHAEVLAQPKVRAVWDWLDEILIRNSSDI